MISLASFSHADSQVSGISTEKSSSSVQRFERLRNAYHEQLMSKYGDKMESIISSLIIDDNLVQAQMGQKNLADNSIKENQRLSKIHLTSEEKYVLGMLILKRIQNRGFSERDHKLAQSSLISLISVMVTAPLYGLSLLDKDLEFAASLKNLNLLVVGVGAASAIVLMWDRVSESGSYEIVNRDLEDVLQKNLGEQLNILTRKAFYSKYNIN